MYSKEIVANGTGSLVGTVVQPKFGTEYSVTEADFVYIDALSREFATWYGATAWAKNLKYSYGTQTITGWRLPTVKEQKVGMNRPTNHKPPMKITAIPEIGRAHV